MINGNASSGFFYDVSTKGREITRAPYGNLRFPTNVMMSALNCSYFLGSSRGQEYTDLVARLSGTGSPKARQASLVASRTFYRSDYVSHHRTGFGLSLKMDSPRMDNNEVGRSPRNQILVSKSYALESGLFFV